MNLLLVGSCLAFGAICALLIYSALSSYLENRDKPWILGIRKILAPSGGRTIDLPVEVLPHLMLGDKKSASDVEVLKLFEITHVCNAAGRAGRQPQSVLDAYVAAGIKLLHLEAEDEEGYPMLSKHLPAASNFMKCCKASGGRCLVHCQAGINRSGLLAASELMLDQQLPVLVAVARLKEVRGRVLWNESFQEQLVALARSHGLLGDAPPPEAQAPDLPRQRKSVATALRGLV